MKNRRVFSLLLSIALTLTLAIPAAAYNSGSLVPQKRTYPSAFADVRGAWCETAVKTVYEAGLMDGKSSVSFDPSGSLTYAQITVITARLHSLLHGGDGVLPAADQGQAWYQPAVSYLSQHVSEDSETGDYLLYDLSSISYFADQPCDRYDFVWYLAAVLPESALPPINTIAVLPDVSDADIIRFYNAGILTGSDRYGTFNGYDELNRGQAAAMLARIVDPAQRVKFTPETLVASQALLGLDPKEPLLSVDGYDVTAEVYAFFLTRNIALTEMENYFSYYETYPAYYEAYWKDLEFDGSFADYLLEKHGIDADAPINWDVPDKGGMTPAQKVREDTLANVKELAVLMSHQSGYPLTSAQKTAMSADLSNYAGLYYGYSDAFAETLLTSHYLQENLTAKYTLSSSQLDQYLAESGYIYGQYAVFYHGENQSWQYASDAEAREAADTVRRQMSSHLGEPDYIEYLIWKYSDDYTTAADLIPISQLSSQSQTTLKNLGVNQVSSVLKEDGAYLVVLKRDPTQNSSVTQAAASIPAQTQLLQWAGSAKVVTAAAYDAISVSQAAAAYDALNF